MVRYLLICYVDTKKVSHDKTVTDAVTLLINIADTFHIETEFVFNRGHLKRFSRDMFINNTFEFFDDPEQMNIGPEYYFEDDEDEEADFVEKIIISQKNSEEEQEFEIEEYVYPEDYAATYVHFTSDVNLATSFYESAKVALEFPKIAIVTYGISLLDQMEIMKKLYEPENEDDKMRRIISATGERKQFLLKQKINERRS